MVSHDESGHISYRIDGVLYHKTFSLSGSSPIPEGKILVHDRDAGSEITVRTITVEPNKHMVMALEELEYSFIVPIRPDHLFLNGFQSWSLSKKFQTHERQRPLNRIFGHWIKKYHLDGYGDQRFVNYPRQPGAAIGHTYGYLIPAGRANPSDPAIYLVASISESLGYTLIRFMVDRVTGHVRVTVQKDCAGLHVRSRMDLVSIMSGYAEGPGCDGTVFDAWARLSGFPKMDSTLSTGWTSWYNHYEKIDEGIILNNLRAFEEQGIPIKIFQIDDGWQAAVGDWTKVNDKFPNGLAPIAREIRKAGYVPGLWLAPFAAEESSSICRDHADWIVRDEHGLVVAGYNPFNWSGTFYGLNIDLPEVREYLRSVFHTVLDRWGFEVVKLDFLYAAAMVPRDGKSRGQIMSEGMDLLRQLVGDRKILGCGVPLGSAAGKVDLCRIGADVSLGWEDKRLRLIRYPERVSTWSALTNMMSRRHLHGRAFVNDPDVFILRDENNKLNPAQKYTLYLACNIFGGVAFTSDDLTRYTPAQTALYHASFPFVAKSIQYHGETEGCHEVHFTIGKRAYIAYLNLTGTVRRMTLPGDDGVHWYEQERGILEGGTVVRLPAYGSCCLSRAPIRPWGVIGTTGRLFPGSEIDQVFHEDNEMTITFREGALSVGDVIVRLPKRIEVCMINGNSALIERQGSLTTGRASLI